MKTIKQLIKEKFPDTYSEEQLDEIIEKKIARFPSFLFTPLQEFLTEGKEPNIEVEGYSFKDLTSEHGIQPIGAFLTLFWLYKEPDHAKEALKKGHDDVRIGMTERMLHPGMYFTKSIEVWKKSPGAVTDKELVLAAEEMLMAAGPTIELMWDLPTHTVSLLVNKKINVVGIVRLPDRNLSREKLIEKSQEQLGILLSLDRHIPIWVPLATLGPQPYVIFEYNK
ncbi:MAG: hypothetical protein HYW79_01325 [Parcubacteria group bacterium]|nr:hypothetical protein [Parcubacteria group bacterium]